MAGHSKWANIRFRKGVQDAKRGKIFTKLIREITVAARQGGGDETSNSGLRDVVTKALKANMKRDTIDQAIKRGLGGVEGQNMVEMRYEGYGPGGVAILVDCLSDNKNRTVSEVRHVFTKHGGHLGAEGSVAYLFSKKGNLLLAPTPKQEQAMDIAIDEGAEDVIMEDERLLIVTPPEQYSKVVAALQHAQFEIEYAALAMQPQTTVMVDKDTEEGLEKLIDALDDLDDVQSVFSNAEFAA